MKKNFLFVFYLVAGILLGAVIADLCAGVPFLSWLSYSQSIGFAPNNPAVLDLSIIKLTFGFAMSISVAQIITILIALYIYNRTRVK